QASHEALSDAYDEVKCLEEELRTNNETLNQVNVQLVELARVDPLTRVLNHRALMDTLERELAHARRHKRACGIMLFDIDHFKALNDGYGHPAGDVILQEFIRIAQGTLRAGDSTGRWGGEEFIVILPDTDATEALMVAERLRATIARHMFHVGGGIHLTCSVGVAVFPEHANARTSLLAAADMAVYAAKQLGRDQVRVVHDTAVQAVESRKDANGSRDEQAFLG